MKKQPAKPQPRPATGKTGTAAAGGKGKPAAASGGKRPASAPKR